MKVKADPRFWEAYERLSDQEKRAAKKAFAIWKDDPFHPSLRFKCVQENRKVWAVRVTRQLRALGEWEEDTFTWFWIGSHDDYERAIKKLS